MNNKKLPHQFYLQEDVIKISRQLLGKYLFSMIDGHLTGGMIIETEAYRGPEDRASHAFGWRRTNRNEVMYHRGGCSYVYICYGIHALLNVVTNKADIPHAVLLRAITPEIGTDVMLSRRQKQKITSALTCGPGSLTQALGITKKHNGFPLDGNTIWIEDRGVNVNGKEILASPRVGIDYAGADALLPWRFQLGSISRCQ